MRDLLRKLRRPLGENRRGIALIMVMMVVSSLLIIGILFSGSVTAEYRAAVYYRQAIQSEQYCLVGLHRAMAEMMYDVWGVYEHQPFLSARYATGEFDATDPETSLRPLGDAAYYDMESGSLKPILRQRGFWNGEAWVVWAGQSTYSGHAAKVTHAGNVWAMDPRSQIHMEITGGAQRYLSFGSGTSAGTVNTNGTAVTGVGTNFDSTWVDNQEIYIDGALYHIDDPVANPITATGLKIKEDAGVKTGVGYYVVGMGDCPPSADIPPTFPGGTQKISVFEGTNKGYAADPRWVNPAAFIKYKPADGTAYKYGGVDIDGSGTVDATDKALRDWALWQLKRDAYLPEAIDNHDLFQPSLHANNRRLWVNGTPRDNGWEFIDPKIIGDSFYQIFRFDPLYSLDPAVSGKDDLTSDSFDDPDVAQVEAGTLRRDGLPAANDINLNPELAKSNQAGYRYPYDRTHLNKWSAVPWADDAVGGLTNINQCNNDYNIEQLTNNPGSGSTPSDLTWYHYSEAKWIYCYDPLNPEKKYGRYAVSIMPDNGTWNASGLQSGVMHVCMPTYSYPHVRAIGDVKAAGGFLGALRAGFSPTTGDSCSATLMPQALNSYAPVRPNPLPHYWCNTSTDPRDQDSDGVKDFVGYFCPDGSPDSNAFPGGGRFPPVDYSRAPEIWGGHGGSAWDDSNGVRSAILNYLLWLGPYDSRAELATHMRNACIAIPSPSPDGHGTTDADRACMETDINNNDADLQKVAQSAMLISALTTVQGYYYTLDRFWDRDLLLVDWSAGTSGDADDMRFSTAQSPRDEPVTFATAAARNSQQTRDRYIQVMLDLECFGGYRTRDGDYKLLKYLFKETGLTDNEYTTYKTNHENGTAPAGYSIAATYGGAGAVNNPAGWSVQRNTNRIEKFMAMTASRIACQQRGGNAKTAACSRGHLVHNPRISSVHKSVWTNPTKTYTSLRTGPVNDAANDNTLDDIGEGCPVCGGKLFQNAVHEVNIGEIGRFYEKFKNAERPVAEAYDVNDPAKKPARHFVELMVYGTPVNGTYIGGSYDVVRFDMLRWGEYYDGSKELYLNYPGVLLDPVTRMPYFTSDMEYGMRHRKPYSDPESMNPEPIFKVEARVGMGSNSGYEWRLLVWDDTDNGGRWHDVTHCVEYGYGGHGNRFLYELKDTPLYNGTHMMITDDSDPDPNKWMLDSDNDLYNATQVRADEKYVIPDPDPAHQQAAAANGFTASLSIYRKMPVRWYGGEAQKTYYLDYNYMGNYDIPLGKWTDANVPTVSTSAYRGVGFKEKMRLSFTDELISNYWADFKYKGDYSDPGNTDGWPGPTSRDGCTRVHSVTADNYDLKYPQQYGIITFDARFDGTKVALVMHSDGHQRPNYSTWQVIDYVELTDSAGTPIKISQACVPDPSDATKMLSWQARNPLDNRSNADGYMCWDLLPMTLQNDKILANTEGRDPTDSDKGYDPWDHNIDTQPDYKWWGNASDGHFSGFDRGQAQSLPPGFMDMWNPVSNCRNSNTYVRDMPTQRWVWDGTTATSRFSKMADVELGLARTDNCTMGYNDRQPNRKECLMSIPTGIGRQVLLADANDPAKTATYAGRQHVVLAGMTWTEGNNTNDSRYKWAAYSWDNWADLFKVTDLCQQMLWDIYPNTAEDRDIFDGDQDGVTDEDELVEDSLTYNWNGGTVSAVKGHFIGELKQINKLNINELWYPPTFKGTEWNSSYTSFGRKPLKGFSSPSDAMTYHFYGTANFEARIKPWDLDNDNSADFYSADSTAHQKRFDAIYASNSTVYTVFVTGNATDQADEPLAEMRARVTVERTWDGRMNILEFTWLPTDRGFME